jgi:hypothetical protein
MGGTCRMEEEVRNSISVLVWKPQMKGPFGRFKCMWENNMKWERVGVNLNQLTQNGVLQRRALVNSTFRDQLSNSQLFYEVLSPLELVMKTLAIYTFLCIPWNLPKFRTAAMFVIFNRQTYVRIYPRAQPYLYLMGTRGSSPTGIDV